MPAHRRRGRTSRRTTEGAGLTPAGALAGGPSAGVAGVGVVPSPLGQLAFLAREQSVGDVVLVSPETEPGRAVVLVEEDDVEEEVEVEEEEEEVEDEVEEATVEVVFGREPPWATAGGVTVSTTRKAPTAAVSMANPARRRLSPAAGGHLR